MTKKVLHVRLEELPFESVGDKVVARSLEGTHMTLLNCRFQQGCKIPIHQHESEQISYILKGCLKGKIGGKEYLVRTGEVIVIPPYQPHEWEALEETITLEVFSPPREKPSFK